MRPTTTAVWKEFGQQLRAFILESVSNPADADDILQEVFIKIHTHIDTLRDEERLIPWLYRITRNTMIDFLRARRQWVTIPETLAVEAEPSEDEAAYLIGTGLHHMINALPDKYRQVLQLAELEGLTQREIAERLGLSLSGAKSRVQRGRRFLRKALLDCCHLELDHRGHLIDSIPRPDCYHCSSLSD